ILSSAIKKLEETEGKFDIILCGKQAIDGDTAQVGPEIAEHLDLPQVTYAVEASVDGAIVKVKKEVDDGFEMIGAKMPCVITVTKPSYDPRYPTIKSKMAANRKEIGTITADDITNIDRERIGLKGSPTKVKKTFTPAVKVGGVKINEDTNEASAKKLFETLCADGII
ncbi:MAG: electron transfer flavoprotein subunit beta/FixA family protein, partial [Oscillospiraceae bacterium]